MSWKKIALIATTIVAIGAAITVVEGYAPWAPRITFALATENTLARLDNQLITLLALEAQAKSVKDKEAIRYFEVQIRDKKRQIKDLEKLKDKHE